jgi:WD40 repeat protein
MCSAEVEVFTGHESDVSSVAFAPAGSKFPDRFASGSQDGQIRVYGSKGLIHLFPHTHDSDGKRNAAAICAIAFSPNGENLVGGDSNGVKVWCARTGNEIRPFPTEGTTSVAYSPDGSLIASGSSEKTVFIWHVASGSGETICDKLFHSEAVTSLCSRQMDAEL